DHGDGQEVLYLPGSQLLHCGIVRGALGTAVPASIVVRAIAVSVAVCLVVLLVVGNEVVECEAVVARYEVDALFGLALFMAVKLRTTEEPVGNPRHRTIIAAEEASEIIPKTPVPLPPTVTDEAADLVKAGRIPRLGEELRPGKSWV